MNSKIVFVYTNIIIFLASFWGQGSPKLLSIMGLFQIVLASWNIYKRAPLSYSVGLVFIIILYIFHSGHGLLFLMGYQFYDFTNENYSYPEYASAQLFTEVCIFLIAMSYFKPMRVMRYFRYSIPSINPKPFLYLFIVTIPFLLIATSLRNAMAVKEGYKATYELQQLPIFNYGSILIFSCIPLAILLVVLYKRQENKLRAICIFVIMISIYSMGSGHRITAVVNIISLSFVYFNLVTTFSKKHFVILSFAVIAFLMISPLISLLRLQGDVDIAHMQQASSTLDNGALYAFLQEFGGTVVSLSYPMSFAGNEYDYLWGSTYFATPFYLFPRLPHFIATSDWYTHATTFVTCIPESYQTSFGGSCLGEMYSNFGWFGSLVSIPLGRFIRYTDDELYKIKSTESISFFSLIIIWCISVTIAFVRSYYCAFFSFMYFVLYYLWKKSIKGVAIKDVR